MNAADNYSLLLEKINRFIRKYYFNRFLRGLIFLGAGLFSAFVVIIVGEYFGNFSTTARSILFYFFILLNVGFISWLILPSLLALLRLRKTITHDQAAEIIGRHFSNVSDKLLNTLQLKKLADANPEHRALIEAGIDQKIEALKPVSFPSAVNLKENARYLKWLIIPAGIICILAFAAPSIITESTKRLIRHNEYFAPISPFQFNIQNSSLSAIQDDDLKLDVKLSGNDFPADVYIETAGNTFKLDKQNTSTFHYQFSNLQQNTVFRLTANGFTSAPYLIKVNLRPALLHFDVDLHYPAYLHKKNETITNAGDLIIPAGTEVKWDFHTQNATGLLFALNGKQALVKPAGTDAFSHEDRIYKNSTFKITPVNRQVTRSDSASYRINVIADEPPTITVQQKQDSVSINALYFNGNIQDDHGFSSLTFNYKIGDPRDKAHLRSFTLPVKADLSQTQADFFYYWNLKDSGIKPGDEVTYYFEVADNDAVNGPQKIRSAERTLNVPTQEELNNQLNTGTQQVKQKMESAVKLAGQIQRDAEKLNEMLLQKNDLSFDDKKQVEDLVQKKKELNDLVKQLQAENEKNMYNRQENQKQDQSLAQKQQQMQQLLNSLLDPKTQQMLQKLQDMLQQGENENTREQIGQMGTDDKSLQKELSRMLELYKKLEFEQKLDQHAGELNNLADKQQQLSDEAKQPAAGARRLAGQQQQLNQEFRDIKKSLDELNKSNQQAVHPQQFDDPKQQEQSIEQQMQNSMQQLSNNSPQKAAQSQQKAAQQMRQLAKQMQQNEQEGEATQNNIDIQQLRELLKNLINSSFDQEALMNKLGNTSTSDPAYTGLAEQQKDIQDNLKTAEDSLYSLSERVPQIQTTVNREIAGINDNIGKALASMADRESPQAMRSQRFAMTSMNNLALMLSEALEQLQRAMSSGKGGKGKQMSLAQMSAMQQQLNQNMQKAAAQLQKQGNQGKAENINNENISEQLAKLARQQAEIRNALERINRDENKDGSGKLGNLDKIIQQMEQTERDLVNRRISEEALKRQQQIHTRLLEAEKAEQEREQDQQRESRAGKDIPPGYIKALKQYQQAKQKQTEQVRTVSPALNFYYKLKIKTYFDLLNDK